MRGDYLKFRKIVHDIFQTARMGKIESFIAAMNEYGQFSLYRVKNLKQSLIVGVKPLSVGVKLYALQPRVQNKFRFLQNSTKSDDKCRTDS